MPTPTIGDPQLVEVLVVNLIDNAIRHNNPGGRIEVSTISAPKRATITVSNTGPVVAPSEVDRLFQPFQRAGSQRMGQTAGHGLGLAVVQAIAHAHRAAITAQARSEGGLEIRVTFGSASN